MATGGQDDGERRQNRPGTERGRQPPVGILIGGTSHVGKSTFARALARSLGRPLISTDDLARHPGRPWPTVRPEVAEYYERLSDDTIHWFLKVHHETMWPRILQILEDHRRGAAPFVMEGAALRPEYLAQLDPGAFRAVVLVAGNDLLRSRILEQSRHREADAPRAALIDRFLERSLRENDALLRSARLAGIPCVDVAVPGALDALRNELGGGQPDQAG